MFRFSWFTAFSVAFIFVLPLSVEAQRRGGGRSGGGISRSATQARPSSSSQFRGQSMSSQRSVTQNSSSINRSSGSINRSSGSINRSSGSINRSSGSINRSSGSINRGSGNFNSANRSNINRGNTSQKPSRSQLDSFLNSSGSSRNSMNTAGRPSTLPAPGSGWNSKTFETANGTKITVGGGSGSKTGQSGGKLGAAGGGVKIETAAGKTATKGGVKVAGQDSVGNRAVGGVGGKQISDWRGNSVGAVGGGAIDSKGNFKGGGVVGAKNQYGYAKVGGRGTAGNINTGNRTTVERAAVRGPSGNVISAGRGAQFVNGQFIGGNSWAAVNGNFTRYNYFGGGYYARYPGAWFPGKWAIAGTAWAATTWAVAGTYCGCSEEGVYYDYEDNVAYQDDTVYYEGEPVGTSEEYYEEASEIASSGEQSSDEEWMPIGVFALIKDADQKETERVIQLALNRDGAIRGNLHDMLTEKVTPVIGAVDKETQRVAIGIEGNDQLLVEVGLYNLTNDEVPILIHFSKDKRQQATLIRLKTPEDEQKQ